MAGGTAVLAQRVLEAVFGDQAIRRLAQTAKDELDARVQALMSAELLRYHRVLDDLAVRAGAGRAAAARPPTAVQRGSGRGAARAHRPRRSTRRPSACPRPRSAGRSSRRR